MVADTSALLAAARGGRADEALRLIAANAELLDARDGGNGWTVLHIFARLSDAAAVSKLISAGADIEARDATFRSPLHLAARADATPTGPGSSGAADLNGESRRSQSIIATLRVLLKAGARVGARDKFGLTPLHHAAQAGHAAVCEFLLSLNTSLRRPRAPIEAESNAEERPLHLAAQGGHADTVRCLLEHGAHPSRSNYLGETPLHLAVRGGDGSRHLSTIRVLCERAWKLDLNVQTARQLGTALHLAAGLGHGKAVKALLAAPNTGRQGGHRGVDLSVPDRSGRTAREVALAEGFADVVGVIDQAAERAAAVAARAAQEQDEGLRRAMREMRVAESGVARGRGAGMDAVMEEGGREGAGEEWEGGWGEEEGEED
jgi:ankyrin repeat protein